MKHVQLFEDFSSKKEVYGKNLSFREVTSMIRKEFPSIEFKITSSKRVYYSPNDESMQIFKVKSDPSWSTWLNIPCKSITIESTHGKLALDISKFLLKNKITAWTSSTDQSLQWGKPTVHIMSLDGAKEVKKMEKQLVKDIEDRRISNENAVERERKRKESVEKYKKLHSILLHVPYRMKFSIPGIGDIALMQLTSSQVTWSTWGSFKCHDANDPKQVEELEKIVDYLCTKSSIKNRLTGSKYGI